MMVYYIEKVNIDMKAILFHCNSQTHFCPKFSKFYDKSYNITFNSHIIIIIKINNIISYNALIIIFLNAY
jgi:hypothetical protein